MTYVIRSNGKKEEFDGEKLLSSIMAAASDAGIMNETGIEAIIKNVMSNTVSSAKTQEVVKSKTLKEVILAQLLRIGVQMAIQKFGASNVTKEDVISELINAGLQMSTKSSKASQSNDLLSQLLGATTGTSAKSSQSNDLLSLLLGAGMQTSTRSTKSSQSNDLLSQLLGVQANSKPSASNNDLEELLKTGMKLANAWMEYNK
ncbi:MAG: transcriptional regulator NrdR [Candidatus Methanofastidiosum methylothiophilum]|nr:MAG: transcriptional regulator NrdR [Candidatus Methanofastidiosum methylthiophilus]